MHPVRKNLSHVSSLGFRLAVALGFGVGFSLLSGCAGAPKPKQLAEFTSYSCEDIYYQSQKQAPDEQLDRVTELFTNSCFKETISLGSFIREQRRDKFYAVTAEVAEIFTPEGSFTEYVLESYERAYLSLIISASFLNLKDRQAARVELRRGYDEGQAYLYNYGTDPVLTLLQAALWDDFDPTMARPFWKALAEESTADDQIREFAKNRIQDIDHGSSASRVNWKIYGVGLLPTLDWKSDFVRQRNGPYKIVPKSEFPPVCSTKNSLLVPTTSWVSKIGSRYQSSYHPLLFTKSLVRLPVGIGYGIVGVTAGVGVGVGGCALAASAKNSNEGGARLCGYSLQLAGYLINQSTQLAEYTLKPDLRHWQKVPRAFYITQNTNKNSECVSEDSLQAADTVLLRR